MVECRFMSVEGTFRETGRATYATVEAALEECRIVYGCAGYTGFKAIEDSDGWRVTATTPGGRHGRNVAFIDATYNPDA